MNSKRDKKITPGQASLASYIAGFILSLILTLTAYSLVVNQVLTGTALIAAIVALALVQLLVQLLFFLHLGKESEPRWNLLLFDFAVLVVVIIVIGSLWIMNNLHYNMTPPGEIERQLLREEGIDRRDDR